MTEYWKTDLYLIHHAAWLLTCTAPSNVAKGKRKYDAMSADDKVKVDAMAAEIAAIYAAHAT